MESDHLLWVHFTVRTVSIHAPRMGSDIYAPRFPVADCYFNSRSPYGERHWGSHPYRHRDYFNSRSPYGERPQILAFCKYCLQFQFSLPVWGATLKDGVYQMTFEFSIHAPRMGSDCMIRMSIQTARFSIHAPRMGSDRKRIWWDHRQNVFNSRSPYGERPKQKRKTSEIQIFNSRSPYGERR